MSEELLDKLSQMDKEKRNAYFKNVAVTSEFEPVEAIIADELPNGPITTVGETRNEKFSTSILEKLRKGTKISARKETKKIARNRRINVSLAEYCQNFDEELQNAESMLSKISHIEKQRPLTMKELETKEQALITQYDIRMAQNLIASMIAQNNNKILNSQKLIDNEDKQVRFFTFKNEKIPPVLSSTFKAARLKNSIKRGYAQEQKLGEKLVARNARKIDVKHGEYIFRGFKHNNLDFLENKKLDPYDDKIVENFEELGEAALQYIELKKTIRESEFPELADLQKEASLISKIYELNINAASFQKELIKQNTAQEYMNSLKNYINDIDDPKKILVVVPSIEKNGQPTEVIIGGKNKLAEMIMAYDAVVEYEIAAGKRESKVSQAEAEIDAEEFEPEIGQVEIDNNEKQEGISFVKPVVPEELSPEQKAQTELLDKIEKNKEIIRTTGKQLDDLNAEYGSSAPNMNDVIEIKELRNQTFAELKELSKNVVDSPVKTKEQAEAVKEETSAELKKLYSRFDGVNGRLQVTPLDFNLLEEKRMLEKQIAEVEKEQKHVESIIDPSKADVKVTVSSTVQHQNNTKTPDEKVDSNIEKYREAYQKSLEGQGLTPEKAIKFAKKNPELLANFADKAAEKDNKSKADWAIELVSAGMTEKQAEDFANNSQHSDLFESFKAKQNEKEKALKKEWKKSLVADGMEKKQAKEFVNNAANNSDFDKFKEEKEKFETFKENIPNKLKDSLQSGGMTDEQVEAYLNGVYGKQALDDFTAKQVNAYKDGEIDDDIMEEEIAPNESISDEVSQEMQELADRRDEQIEKEKIALEEARRGLQDLPLIYPDDYNDEYQNTQGRTR